MQRLTAWRSVSAVLRGCGSTRATAAASSSCYTSVLINGSSPGNVERSNKVRWASSLSRLQKLFSYEDARSLLRLQKLLQYEDGRKNVPGLDIHIKTNIDNGVITITDSGIGMSRETLASAVPVITTKFKDGSNLIGTRKVVEKLEVSTKCPLYGKQYVWVWEELNSIPYTIHEETDPSRLIPGGTRLRFYLKRDDNGFEMALKELASSNHLTRAGLPLKLLDCIVLKDAKHDIKSSAELEFLRHGSGFESMDAQLKCAEQMMHLKSDLLKREGGL